MIRSAAALLVSDALQGAAVVLLWVGDLATPTLAASRWCQDRAREWDPRLWDRDHDPRSDERDRRP